MKMMFRKVDMIIPPATVVPTECRAAWPAHEKLIRQIGGQARRIYETLLEGKAAWKSAQSADPSAAAAAVAAGAPAAPARTAGTASASH